MSNRRPTATDRNIVDFLRSLPKGAHRIHVTAQHEASLKPEGGMTLYSETTTIVIEPRWKP